jgi:protein TonB
MFEDSTFESSGKIRTRSRGWMIATFALNGAIVLALILIPLFYPEALPRLTMTMLMQAPLPPAEAPKPLVHIEHAVTASAPAASNPFTAPPRIPHGYTTAGPEPSLQGDAMSLDNPGPAGIPGIGCDPSNCNSVHIDVRPAVQPARQISHGVMEGMLVDKVPPVYPPLARNIRLGGTVVLQATISKSGTIENLRVVSGPALLQQAALDAVRQWRYRPYLLNNEPVEVETTVNVDFTLQ